MHSHANDVEHNVRIYLYILWHKKLDEHKENSLCL